MPKGLVVALVPIGVGAGKLRRKSPVEGWSAPENAGDGDAVARNGPGLGQAGPPRPAHKSQMYGDNQAGADRIRVCP